MLKPPARQLPLRGHMQTPTQGRSPRFRVAKPLKGFAPLLFRECRRLSSCKRRMCPLGFGRDITPTLLSHAWRIRSVLCRTKSAIFQGRPQCPLMVGLCLQSRLHHALPFLRNAHVMRNTANLLGRPFCGRWLTAISPCLFVPVELASPLHASV